MKEFKACLKKEFIEQFRTGKFLIFTVIGIGMAFLAFLTIGMMQAINELGLDMGEMAANFEPTFLNGTMMFMAYMQSYFYIPIIIMVIGCVSKEIKLKKWTLPISCGISPSKMIAAKFVVVVSSVVVASIIAMLFHFALTLLLSLFFMRPTINFVSDIGNMFRNYGLFTVFTIFLMIMIISMNAITKKIWPGIVLAVGIIILLPTILNTIIVGGENLINYTPFFYLNEVSKASYMLPTGNASPSPLQWISSSLSTIGISALFVFFAIKSTRIGKIAD
ncbi:MAG: hypothetical protein WCR30_03985 [Clostridia bacterium]